MHPQSGAAPDDGAMLATLGRFLVWTGVLTVGVTLLPMIYHFLTHPTPLSPVLGRGVSPYYVTTILLPNLALVLVGVGLGVAGMAMGASARSLSTLARVGDAVDATMAETKEQALEAQAARRDAARATAAAASLGDRVEALEREVYEFRRLRPPI